MSEMHSNDVCAVREGRIAAWLHEFHRSSGEEWANFATHLAGMLFGVFALTFMCVLTAQQGDPRKIVSCAVYGFTLIVLYNCSMLYHLVWRLPVKAVLQTFDHVSIYLLIAGTYTPFTLVSLAHTAAGWTLFGVSWGLAVLGILSELLIKPRKEWIALLITLAMGWEIVFAFGPLLENISHLGLVMLVVGGVVYTLGVIFYVMDRVPYMHTVWHCFVLGGSVCHWVAITFGEILG